VEKDDELALEYTKKMYQNYKNMTERQKDKFKTLVDAVEFLIEDTEE